MLLDEAVDRRPRGPFAPSPGSQGGRGGPGPLWAGALPLGLPGQPPLAPLEQLLEALLLLFV